MESSVLTMDWEKKEKGLTLVVEMKDFNEVIEIVNKIAGIAEELDHHPDLDIFDYKKLKITLFSHEEDKITEKDYLLASEIEKILKTQSPFEKYF